MQSKIKPSKRILFISLSLIIIVSSLLLGLQKQEVPVGIQDVLANKGNTIITFNPIFLFAGALFVAFLAVSAKSYSTLSNSMGRFSKKRNQEVVSINTLNPDLELDDLHQILKMEHEKRELSEKVEEVSLAEEYLHEQKIEIEKQVHNYEDAIKKYVAPDSPLSSELPETASAVADLPILDFEVIAPAPKLKNKTVKTKKSPASKISSGKKAAKKKPISRRKKTA